MTQHNLIPPHEKRKIYNRQHGLCAYCGRRRRICHMTVDHIIPLSKGGADNLDNMQCTCKACNKFKSDMMPDEFTEIIRRILENSMAIEKAVAKSSST